MGLCHFEREMRLSMYTFALTRYVYIMSLGTSHSVDTFANTFPKTRDVYIMSVDKTHYGYMFANT